MRDPLLSPLVPSRRWWRKRAPERKAPYGYATGGHIATHADGDLVTAALAYIYACTDAERGNNLWPFEPETFKPSWPVDNLVKAGGLIDAEIGRLRSLPSAGTFRP